MGGPFRERPWRQEPRSFATSKKCIPSQVLDPVQGTYTPVASRGSWRAKLARFASFAVTGVTLLGQYFPTLTPRQHETGKGLERPGRVRLRGTGYE
jgi:hypothetical protein